jgi:CheY-like chemotaxis protein
METSVLSIVTCLFQRAIPNTTGRIEHIGMIERQALRFVVQLPLVFSGDRFGSGTLLNLSSGGCLVESEAAVRAGDSLTLRILLSVGAPPLRVNVAHVVWAVDVATVVWVEEGTFGLSFGRMSSSERERFNEYLQTLRIPVSKRVLIIMGSSDVVAALRQRLQPWGCMIKTASDGGVALADVHRFQPHLIILDVEMPAGGGIVLIEQLKSSTVTRDIPIIVLTAWTDTSILERVLGLGVTNYLYNPIGIDACVADVKRLLGIDQP